MKGASVVTDKGLESMDLTQPDGEVEVQVDRARGVLYVHAEGRTVLRICRISHIYINDPEQVLREARAEQRGRTEFMHENEHLLPGYGEMGR